MVRFSLRIAARMTVFSLICIIISILVGRLRELPVALQVMDSLTCDWQVCRSEDDELNRLIRPRQAYGSFDHLSFNLRYPSYNLRFDYSHRGEPTIIIEDVTGDGLMVAGDLYAYYPFGCFVAVNMYDYHIQYPDFFVIVPIPWNGWRNPTGVLYMPINRIYISHDMSCIAP